MFLFIAIFFFCFTSNGNLFKLYHRRIFNLKKFKTKSFQNLVWTEIQKLRYKSPNLKLNYNLTVKKNFDNITSFKNNKI